MDLQLLAPDGKPYIPLPKQAQFHASPAKFRAYVGGFGSGKTLSGCAEALAMSLDQPGNVGLIGRRSYKELKATTQAEFLRLCPRELIAEHNKSDGILTLKNGSKILFWNLQDADTFKSLNLGWFYLDEASEVDEQVFTILRGRLRLSMDSTGAPIRRCGWVTTNPNGHDWIWSWWVSKQSGGYVSRNYHLIHAPTKENKFLPRDYIRDLENTYPAEWLSRFMEGSFDVFEGQVYPMLSERVHMIPPSMVGEVRNYIRPMIKLRAIDHGYNNPTVCLWAAIDYYGNAFFYREYRRTRKLVSENAQAIRTLSEGEEYVRTLIDPSTRNKTGVGDGRNVLEEYREQGIIADPANNQIKAGILRVSDYLSVRPDLPNPITGKKGAPMLYFFPECAPTFEELRQMQWKKIKPGQEKNDPEEPVDKDDHGPDCVRYLLMDRPRPSAAQIRKSQYQVVVDHVNALSGLNDEEDSWPRIGSGPDGAQRTVEIGGFTYRN